MMKGFLPEIFLTTSTLFLLLFDSHLTNSLKYKFLLLEKEIFIQIQLILYFLVYLVFNNKLQGVDSSQLFIFDNCLWGSICIFITFNSFCFIGHCSTADDFDPAIESLTWLCNLPIFEIDLEIFFIFLMLSLAFFIPQKTLNSVKVCGGVERFFFILPPFILLAVIFPVFNFLNNMENFGFSGSYFWYMKQNYPDLVPVSQDLDRSVEFSYNSIKNFKSGIPAQGHDIYYGKCCYIGDVNYHFTSVNPAYIVLRTAQIVDITSNLEYQIKLPGEDLFMDSIRSLFDTLIFITVDVLFIEFFKAVLGNFDQRSNLFQDGTFFGIINMYIEERVRWGAKGLGEASEIDWMRYHIQENLRNIIDQISWGEKKKQIIYPFNSPFHPSKVRLPGFARYDLDGKTGNILFTHPDGTVIIVPRASPYTGFKIYDEKGAPFEYSDELRDWMRRNGKEPREIWDRPCPKFKRLRVEHVDPTERAKLNSKNLLSYLIWGTVFCGTACYAMFKNAQPILDLVLS